MIPSIANIIWLEPSVVGQGFHSSINQVYPLGARRYPAIIHIKMGYPDSIIRIF